MTKMTLELDILLENYCGHQKVKSAMQHQKLQKTIIEVIINLKLQLKIRLGKSLSPICQPKEN